MSSRTGGFHETMLEFWKQNLFIIFFTEVLFYTSFALLIPTLPLYLQTFNIGTAQIGLVMSIFAIGLLASRPYIGKFIDQYGARCILRYGGAILMGSSILYAFVPSLIWVYPIRIVHGVGMALHSTSSNAIVASSTTADKRGGVMGLFGISRALAFGVGPVLGGLILGIWGHMAVFIAAALLGLASTVAARFAGDCSRVEIETNRKALKDFFLNRTLLFCTVAMFLLTVVHGGLTTFLPIHVTSRMAGNLGTFYLLYSITITLVEIFAGKASDQQCRIPIVLTSVALLGIGFIAVGNVSGALGLVLAAIIYGAGFGGFQVGIGAFVGDQTNDQNRGQVFSVFYSSFDLGMALSGVVMGVVAAGVGLAGMFYISSVVVLPSILLLMFSPPGGLREAFSCGLLGDFRPGFRHMG
ncbi:MAG: MFS transporter, partial [Nitrospinota bacterium]